WIQRLFQSVFQRLEGRALRMVISAEIDRRGDGSCLAMGQLGGGEHLLPNLQNRVAVPLQRAAHHARRISRIQAAAAELQHVNENGVKAVLGFLHEDVARTQVAVPESKRMQAIYGINEFAKEA